MIIDKPFGIATFHLEDSKTSLTNWFKIHLNEELINGDSIHPKAGGLTLLARSLKSAKELKQLIDQGKISKTYFFISRVKSDEESWLCNNPINDKPCQTQFTRLKKGGDFFLYQATIKTELKNQIQIHAADQKIPVFESNSPRKHGNKLFLHCSQISIEGITPEITIPLPSSFEIILNEDKKDQQQPFSELQAAIALEKRGHLLSDITNAFRVIHRGEIGEFAIDFYNHQLLISAYIESNTAQQLYIKLLPIITYIDSQLTVSGGMLRNQNRNPHNNKLSQDHFYFGNRASEDLTVLENGLKYGITLSGSQHTGLFLDHRDSRKKIASLAKGKRVANLFSFTCSFSVAAASAEAEIVFSIDLAGSALQKGKENFEYNQLTETNRGKFIKEDVRKWLDREIRKKERQGEQYKYWDLIICDPPVFASGKGGQFSVGQAWEELSQHCSAILSTQGTALFSNNHRGGDNHYYQETLEKYFENVKQQQTPIDFPIESTEEHVRIYWCNHKNRNKTEQFKK